MSDTDLVVDAAEDLRRLMTRYFGPARRMQGRSGGLGTTVTEFSARIPFLLERRLQEIAQLRNKLAHRNLQSLPDRAEFERHVAEAKSDLENLGPLLRTAARFTVLGKGSGRALDVKDWNGERGAELQQYGPSRDLN